MRIGNTWGSLRGTIRDSFSFAQIKDLVGAAGLSVHTLAHLQQKFSGGASKGQLMDAIDTLVGQLPPDDQDRFVIACIAETLARNSRSRSSLETVLSRVGWGLIGTEPHPFHLQIDLDTTSLQGPIREGIANCLRRYRDGDTSGAMTSVCGIVDSLTEHIYSHGNLGNHRDHSYQQRITRAFSSLEDKFVQPLTRSSTDPQEISRLWDNYRGSINQAAYVLGSFRREFSDSHGVKIAPPELIQRALDCAIFIIRSFTGLM